LRGAALTGWGAALPDQVVTNHDFEARGMQTSDEWIVERTGIRERRWGGTTSRMAVDAGRQAIEQSGLEAQDIDLLVLATTTPDQQVPATSATVAGQLGLRCGALDLNAACSGFVYAVVVANGLIATGYDRILVIGSDALSKITDVDDRATAILFADAAGAVVLEAAPEGQLLGWDLGVDGTAVEILDCDIGGFIHMDGKEVFRRAVRAMAESARAAMERAKVGPDDIALVVPHQANARIIEAANSRIGIPMERAAMVLDRTGNTSSASIPVALADAADQGRLAAGDLVLLCGFGAGMTWASAVLRWGAP